MGGRSAGATRTHLGCLHHSGRLSVWTPLSFRRVYPIIFVLLGPPKILLSFLLAINEPKWCNGLLTPLWFLTDGSPETLKRSAQARCLNRSRRVYVSGVMIRPRMRRVCPRRILYLFRRSVPSANYNLDGFCSTLEHRLVSRVSSRHVT